ncbi:MAG: hypothetical protein GY769_20965 [bacterium]|nr:hypothetical protein [bacterium]
MTPRVRSVRAMLVVCLMCAIAPAALSAQANTSLEFSFSNPGARSLGFGGAFIALADDATAAFANPAGLIQIAEPELSVEGRSWSYSTPYTSGGRAAGEPTGRGIDTVAVPLRAESTADLTGLSYVSLVYPRTRWSLAFFQHQLANFEFGLETQGLFGPVAGVSDNFRSQIQTSRIDLEILTRGLALGFRAGDKWSLGLGLSHLDPSILIFGWDYLPDENTVESHFSEASFLPERLEQIVTLEGNEADWGLTAGFLWRMTEHWNLGGLYRQGADFDFELSLEAGPADPDLPPGFRIVDGFEAPYSFPDVFGLGAAYRSRDGRWTGALEWKRVEYSTFLESLLPQQRDDGETLDDADEIHLGGEYAFFAGTSVLAIRLGLWHDPDHQIRSEADPAEEPFLRAILPAGEDELHLTGGFGIAFERLQIDLGIDLSERIDTASLSAIYGF